MYEFMGGDSWRFICLCMHEVYMCAHVRVCVWGWVGVGVNVQCKHTRGARGQHY